MLQTQLVDLVFTGGADNKTDSKNTLFTNFTEMKNSRTDKLNAVRPRHGVIHHPLTSEVEPARLTQGFGTVASPGLNMHLAHGLSWRVTPASEIIAGAEVRGMPGRQIFGETGSRNMAVAHASDRVCTVWRNTSTTDNGTGKIYFNLSTYDGTIVTSGYFNTLSATSSPELFTVVTVNDTFLVFYTDGANLLCQKILEQETPLSSAVTLSTPVAATDWDIVAEGNQVFIAIGAVVSRYTANTPVTTLTLNNSVTLGTTVKTLCLLGNYAGNGRLAAVGTNGSNLTEIFVTDAVLTTVYTSSIASAQSAPTRMWAAQRNTNVIAFGYTAVGAYEKAHVRHYYTSAGSITTDPIRTFTADLICQPFYHDDRLLAPMDTYTEPTYGSQALVEYVQTTGAIDVALLCGVSKNLGYRLDQQVVNRLPRAILAGGSKWYVPMPVVGSAVVPNAGAGAQTPGVAVIDATIQASNVTIDTAQFPSKLIDNSDNQQVLLGTAPRFAGGYRQVTTAWPELSTESNSTLVAGGFTGTLSYVFAKLVTMPDGTEYRAYGPIQTRTGLASQTVEFTLSAADFYPNVGTPTGLTAIEFYRATQNGSVFYLDSTYYVGGTYTPVSTDAALITKRLADINGAELYPEPPAAIRNAVQWKDRIAAVMVDKGTVIKFSKQTQYPQGTAFADGLEIDVGTDGGDITALGALDQSLIVFKQNSILTLYGDPAGNTGGNSSLGVPTVLRNGLGCIDPQSVVLTPRGLMFNSQKGFCILARNQEWQFIGEGPYDRRSERITGAALNELQMEVTFTYQNGAIWTFNYETSQWYEYVSIATVRGAAQHGDEMVMTTDSGWLEFDTSNNLTDQQIDTSLTAIPQTYTTGWLRPGHIEGYQRVKRLYLATQALQDDTLTVSVYVDYRDGQAVQVRNFPFTTSFGPTEFELHLAVQKCEAMKFKFSTTKASLVLSGATLEMGVKQGGNKARNANVKG